MEADLPVIKRDIEKKLEKGILGGGTLMRDFCFPDERIKSRPAFDDPRYAPFYYWLGQRLQPQSLFVLGLNLGLLSGCFLSSCKSVKTLLAFQPARDDAYYLRVAKANLKRVYGGHFDFHRGNLFDEAFTDKFFPNLWDLALINDETHLDTHTAYLDVCWDRLSEGGVIVMEYLNVNHKKRSLFESFCEGKDRDAVIVGTRFGTGMVQK